MLLRLISVSFLLHTTSGLLTWQQLHGKFNEIFPRTHNRKAASHLWSTYILNHVSGKASAAQIYKLFSAFCPISGAIVTPMPFHTWKNLKIKSATNKKEKVTGTVSFCCNPCPCDTEDFVAVDTKQIKTKDGTKSFQVLVIGDPCKKPNKKIPDDAAELYCEDGRLHGSTLSDHGHVIIGMLQPSDKNAGRDAADTEHQKFCTDRSYHGYHGPVGSIFVQLALINPV